MKRLLLALFLICFAATAHRINLASELPYFDPLDGTGFYRVESVLQFRYARMVAEGTPIPTHD